MRLDNPVGTLLLLWPTLAALWMAAEGLPTTTQIVVFCLGTLLMRSAGCVINDIADRDFDGHVFRTQQRPLATGAISVRQAWITVVALCLLTCGLLPFLSPLARWLSIGGAVIAAIYPFAKRWTYMPQVILGAAFSWGIILAFATVQNTIPQSAWLLFIASLLWIVAYDTLYAMVDREDDLKIGVKSTAILFGTADRFMIALLQALTLLVLWFLGKHQGYHLFYYIGLFCAGGLFIYQLNIIKKRDPAACLAAFRNNMWVGLCLFLGVMFELQFADELANAFPEETFD